MWAHLLHHYDDKIVAEFLKYGWPINYSSHQSPLSTPHNHQSALTFADHICHYIKMELSFGAGNCWTFFGQPTQEPSHLFSTSNCSETRFVKTPSHHGLEFSPSPFCKQQNYLDSSFNFPLPGIDRLCKLVLSEGCGCLVYKKDLQHAYHRIPIDPRDYHL